MLATHKGVPMIRVNIQLYGAAHTFLLEGLLAIGLAAVTAPERRSVGRGREWHLGGW